MTKELYKEMFLRSMQYVKYSNVCKECHVSYSNFNGFINGKHDQAISVNKLEELRLATLKYITESLDPNNYNDSNI